MGVRYEGNGESGCEGNGEPGYKGKGSLCMRVMVSLGKRVIVTLDTRVKVSQAVLSQWNPPQTTISTVKSRKKRKVLPT